MADHAQAIANIREQAAVLGSHTAILADLCGPKIRTGRFAENPLQLVRDTEVTVTTPKDFSCAMAAKGSRHALA